MLSNLSPAMQQFLNNLNQIGDRMQKAQAQVSTGLKITQASDAPDQISSLLQARASLGSTQQTLSNLGRATTEVNAGEQALQTAVQLFDQVQTLGTEGDSSLQTATTKATLAQQLDSILQQMVGLTGTTVEGRYIFSGDSDQQVPYTYDATQSPPVSAYLGQPSTRVIQDPNGATFSVALTAQQIFDSADPTTNVFSAIEGLSTALKNNDSAAIQTSVSGLAGVASYLNAQLATYGTTQDRITSATDLGNNLQTQLQTQISGIQDADMTQSILDMTQAQTQQQAALDSESKLPQQTLFSYLG